MVRLISPASACVGVDVGTHRYTGRRLEVTDPGDVAALKAYGYIDPGPGGATAHHRGYVCGCGFRGWFKRCGRCGQEAHRE